MPGRAAFGTRRSRPRHYPDVPADLLRRALLDQPVDGSRACRSTGRWPSRNGQRWSRPTARLGHRVDLLDPIPGLPDMVYAANGAVRRWTGRAARPVRQPRARPRGGRARRVASAQRHPVRRRRRQPNRRRSTRPRATSPCCRSRILAGYGFRTSRAAHGELATLTGREVISLELVDPRLYHLDVALTVLDDERDHLAYYPDAFSQREPPAAGRVLPGCDHRHRADAYAFGLNCVSDGLQRLHPRRCARSCAPQIAAAGYRPISIDLSELIKGGGSVKCCTQEIRPARRPSRPMPTPR